MSEKRQAPLEDLKEPKKIAGLASSSANLEAKLRNFRLEVEGFSGNRATAGYNSRGEEVEKRTGYVYPLPPSQ